MSWKQFMKNDTVIFVFKNSYWLIIVTNDSISPFSIWRLPLGNMIKTLSDLGTNMKILLLLKVQILHSNLSTEVQTRAKKILPLFFELKKKPDWDRFIF